MTGRELGRHRRHQRIRKRVVGMPHRLRMAVFRSHRHLVVQLVNDFEQKTVLGRSTGASPFREKFKDGGDLAAAEHLGRLIAAEALKHGITHVVFDRAGYRYHGRIKAFAEAARQGGLQF